MKTLTAVVSSADDGTRLDVYLAAQELGLSRRKIRQVIDVGGVYVNKKRVRIASWAVRQNDRISVEYSEASLQKIRTQAVAFQAGDLLHDGGGVIAVNKPPGMPSQATKDQSIMHVVPCLEALLKSQGSPRRKLILVHRLDKETSGVLLVADGAERATWLTEQFRERKVKKIYHAICYGLPARDAFTESAPLSEIDKKTGNVRAVRAGGRAAVTHFRVLAKNAALGICLMECRPETGRSHQIRVHLDINGLPIVGDKRYGREARRPLPPALAELATEHQFLHAARLELKPAADAKTLTLTAQPPERFARFLAAAALTPTA